MRKNSASTMKSVATLSLRIFLKQDSTASESEKKTNLLMYIPTLMACWGVAGGVPSLMIPEKRQELCSEGEICLLSGCTSSGAIASGRTVLIKDPEVVGTGFGISEGWTENSDIVIWE